jgi:ubiquinone/menaquinone biosynthesis C-methylase UbiE
VSEAVLDPLYWKRRLETAPPGSSHHAVFKCDGGRWERIARRHKEILGARINSNESVLDCGCGWGRLLDLMPGEWKGWYLGIDLSPDFITLASERYADRPHVRFAVADLRDLSALADGEFDWATLVSVRGMIRRNCGDEVWASVEAEVRRVAKKLLVLEYDEGDNGSVE